MKRDEAWLARAVAKCETVEECKLTVSLFLAERMRMPLAPRFAGPPALRLVEANACTKDATSNV